MIYYFNPGHETAVLNTSPYYTAPANVTTMQEELSYLPAWYGCEGDRVLVNSEDEYLSFLHKHFPTLPKAILKEQLINYADSEVSPWGISPQIVHYFNEMNKELKTNLLIPKWEDKYISLNSRQAAKDCLSKLISNIASLSDLILPKFYTTLEAIEEAVDESSCRLLAKAPYSSSGRGLLWLPTMGLTRTERQILHGILKKQGHVSIERVLDKQTDFAMEFMSDGKGKIDFVGYSLFYTNPKGAYESNYIGSQDSIEKQLTEKIPQALLTEVKENLIGILKQDYATIYKGCIGVDMLVYKENEEYKLQPCLEINMRYNMGYLALKLYDNYISPSSYGKYYIDFSPRTGEVYQKHLEMQQKFPALIQNGKLTEGYMPLCPVNENSRYWAYTLINLI